jgi:predicted RNase H-like nuclease (RuvC/YqgF family)
MSQTQTQSTRFEKTNIFVKLYLSNEQRIKAIAKGFGEAREFNRLTLPLTEDALQLLDANRVVIDGKMIRVLDSVAAENEYDVDKPTVVKLDTSGYGTNIESRFVDYVISSGKEYIDADALKTLYRIQDEELERVRQKIEAKKEKERKLREARELLKDEIEAYKKKIEALEKKIEEKSNEIASLNRDIEGLLDVIKNYAKFIKSKNLVSEFIAFIESKQRKESEDKIREKYMLEEEEEEE